MTLAALALLAACTTTDIPVAIPGTGERPEARSLRGRYLILGVENRVTHLRSPVTGPANARGFQQQEPATEFVPVGTRVIVPALTGWAMGYGTADGLGRDPRQTPFPGPPLIGWERENAYFGMGQVDVTVHSISGTTEPVGGQMMRRAVIGITLRLSDWWQDKPWWAEVRYQLIFLGCADISEPCA